MIDLVKLEEQLNGLMYMQDQLEVHLNGEDWKEQGHNYKLCVIMECCEAIDHYGYKHWKHTVPDIPAAKMELVDILHFWLAIELVEETDPAEWARAMLESMANTEASMTFTDAMLGIIGCLTQLGVIPSANFFSAMDKLGMTWDELHMLYVCKNTLNVFRRDNGYMDGTYVKNWDGVEDNIHAEAIARSMSEDLLASVLYDELKSAYAMYGIVKH